MNLFFIFAALLGMASSCQKSSTPAVPGAAETPLVLKEKPSLMAKTSCSNPSRQGFYALSNTNSLPLILSDNSGSFTSNVFTIYNMSTGTYAIRTQSYRYDSSTKRRGALRFVTWSSGRWQKTSVLPEKTLSQLLLTNSGTLTLVDDAVASEANPKAWPVHFVFESDLRDLKLKGQVIYLSRVFTSRGPMNRSPSDFCPKPESL